jgi:hypothetical protein
MSNPEYKTEMNFKNKEKITLWESRVMRAININIDGLVVG